MRARLRNALNNGRCVFLAAFKSRERDFDAAGALDQIVEIDQRPLAENAQVIEAVSPSLISALQTPIIYYVRDTDA